MINDSKYTEYHNNTKIEFKEINGVICCCFIALRDIKKGEELFYGYDEEYWKYRLTAINPVCKDGQLIDLRMVDVKSVLDTIDWKAKCEIRLSLAIQKITNEEQMGLFAAEDISVKDIITYYPTHLIVTNMDKTNTVINKPDGEEYTRDYVSLLCKKYSVICDGFRVVGDPNKIHDCNFLGHMCNDANNTDYSNNAFLNISKDSNGKTIIIVHPLRDIKKDEEIFYDYGKSYIW